MALHVCTDDDLDLLASLNKQLIEDERHDNTMTIDQLKERMRGFIHADYKAYLFTENGETKGYALVDHFREPVYVRHFFVCRDSRRNGYGKLAFRILADELRTDKIDIEVMSWNERGYMFWRSLGLKERSVYMRLEGDGL